MTNQIEIAAPAKINIFLKVLNKRLDGYHNIRSGITFVNLFDKVVIKNPDGTRHIFKREELFAGVDTIAMENKIKSDIERYVENHKPCCS